MNKRKRIIGILLALVLSASVLSPLSFAEGETELLLGDVNGDGKVETVDARLILRVAAGIEKCNDEFILSGDMDGNGVITVSDAVQALKKAVDVADEMIPEKNGDNIISFDEDNIFIKLISEKYDLDPDSLVAIYSVPDSGTNYVLEFKGSGLLGNKPPYEKSTSNLKKVYTIGMIPEGGKDSDRPIAYTNGKLLAGDHYNCEAAEGVLVFNIVQTMVMQQHPDYFIIDK